MQNFDRITQSPGHMNGQACVRGLRITVRRVIEALATYGERADVLREYPELEVEDLAQALAYAATMMDDKVVLLPKSAWRIVIPMPDCKQETRTDIILLMRNCSATVTVQTSRRAAALSGRLAGSLKAYCCRFLQRSRCSQRRQRQGGIVRAAK
jgi:uncharacterized protein (DUF433 family)